VPPRGRPFFRKLLLSAFLLLAFALFFLDFDLTRYTAQRETYSVEQRLISEAHLLADELSAVPLSDLPRYARDSDRRAQARVTLINPSGIVLADSQHSADTMENHSNRPEVRDALHGRIGSSVRHSDTLNRDLCYVAIPLTYRGEQGLVLRLAVPLQELDNAVAAVRWRILYVSFLTAAVGLAFAYFFSLRVSRRINRLRAFAERLLHSDQPEILTPEVNDELGALSRTLNAMGQQLRDLIERLRIESSRRQAILSSMVEGVLAVDHEMRILFCNDSFARAIGASTSPPERIPVLSLVRDSAFVSMLAKVLATGEPLKTRIHLPVTGDRAFEVQAAPLVASERSGVIAILHDITEIEFLERIRKDFVANVSHELRTPLTAIQGYAETLLDGALEDASINRTFLETIKAHAIRLNNISADLLTLSELDSGASAAPVSTFSVKDSIVTALRTVESEASIRGVRVSCEDVEDITICGNKLHLELAIINLLDNAIKFNRPGGEVRVDVSRPSGREVRITIADTGVGIPAQELPRIFERFYRVDKARSRQVGGTGLGLAIVKHAVELMNGRVEVSSELGKGSVFSVTLPT
jgi:two-component system phosphate regulon sensor histidine kinase PhoR